MLMKVFVRHPHVCVDVIGAWVGDPVPAHALAFVWSDELIHYSESFDYGRVAVGQNGERYVVLRGKVLENLYRVIADCEDRIAGFFKFVFDALQLN